MTCERLPLVSYHYYSFSQYPWLRGGVSSDCDRRKSHQSGVWVQWHTAPQPYLEEGWWVCVCVCKRERNTRAKYVSYLICDLCVSGSELKSDQRLRILSGGRHLQISSAERTDAASYTCTASSASGITSKEYSLQVYGTWVPPYLWHLVTKVISVVFLPFISGKEG